MNPHQQNKIDVKSLNPDEQRLLRMYGKAPNRKDLLQNKLKERKYFDSGDYALSKAGKASDVGVTSIGSSHPVPENIPHLAATSPPQGNQLGNGHGHGHAGSTGSQSHHHHGGSVSHHNGFSPSISRSPVKEGSYLRRSSADGKEALTQDESQPAKGAEKEQHPEDSTHKSPENDPSPPPHKEGLPIRR